MAKSNRFPPISTGSIPGSAKRGCSMAPDGLPQVVSGLYEKLDELRKLYGSDSIEEIVEGIIDRRKRLNRMVDLQNKVVLSLHELNEFQVLKRQNQQYLGELGKQRAQARAIDGKIGMAKGKPRS